MTLKIVLLVAGSFLIGHAQTVPSLTVPGSRADLPAVQKRLRTVQRRFPPEVWNTAVQANIIGKSTSYCVSRSPESRSLLFRRCLPQNKIRLLPRIEVPPQQQVP